MKRSVLLRVLTAVVAVLVIAAVSVTVTGNGDEKPEVVAYFDDASPLNPGSEVRASGVAVGKVRDIKLVNGKARVRLDVEPFVLPLHRDARIKLRPVNLLGAYYVELDAGSDAEPFMEEAVVPPERTDSAVSLQDVINTFDDPTSTSLAALVTTLGEGMRGSGGKGAEAIKALAPAMQRTGRLGDILREQNGVLNNLVDRVRPVAEALAAKKGQSLDQVVASTERTLSTLAANQRAVDQTVAELPGTLTEARRTLGELAGTGESATPALKAARPVTDNLAEISGELQRFADAADPAVASLEPVLNRADTLFKQAAPVVEQLRKAGPDVRGTAEKLRPLGDELLNEHLGDLMAFVKKWSLSTNGRDGLSHYFRAMLHVTPKTLQELTSSLLPTGNGGMGEQPADPSKALPQEGESPLENLPVGPKGDDPGNVTGLTPDQEQSMLGQLLGGG